MLRRPRTVLATCYTVQTPQDHIQVVCSGSHWYHFYIFSFYFSPLLSLPSLPFPHRPPQRAGRRWRSRRSGWAAAQAEVAEASRTRRGRGSAGDGTGPRGNGGGGGGGGGRRRRAAVELRPPRHGPSGDGVGLLCVLDCLCLSSSQLLPSLFPFPCFSQTFQPKNGWPSMATRSSLGHTCGGRGTQYGVPSS